MLEPMGCSVLHIESEALKKIGSIGLHLCCRTRSSVFVATRGRVRGWLPSWLTFLCDERRSLIRTRWRYLSRAGVKTSPFTLCLQIRTSQASKSLILNFWFRRTLRASSQVVVGFANRDRPAICASRPPTASISAACRIG